MVLSEESTREGQRHTRYSGCSIHTVSPRDRSDTASPITTLSTLKSLHNNNHYTGRGAPAQAGLNSTVKLYKLKHSSSLVTFRSM